MREEIERVNYEELRVDDCLIATFVSDSRTQYREIINKQQLEEFGKRWVDRDSKPYWDNTIRDPDGQYHEWIMSRIAIGKVEKLIEQANWWLNQEIGSDYLIALGEMPEDEYANLLLVIRFTKEVAAQHLSNPHLGVYQRDAH